MGIEIGLRLLGIEGSDHDFDFLSVSCLLRIHQLVLTSVSTTRLSDDR